MLVWLRLDNEKILDLVAREMARKHTAFYNIGFSEAKAFFRPCKSAWGRKLRENLADKNNDRVVPAVGNRLHLIGLQGCRITERTDRLFEFKMSRACAPD